MTLSTQIERIRSAEVRLAQENAAFLRAMGIIAIHLLASPGAGKTSLISRTVETLAGQMRLAAIQGGVSSRKGHSPLEELDIPVVWVDTGGHPYLDASMIREALEQLPLADVDLLMIEEIGSLTSPGEHSLGENLRVVITSLPEGEDCPLRYPEPFRRADAIILNKLDLLPYLDFNRSHFHKAVQRLNAQAPIFELSCRTGEGLEEWWNWLREQVRNLPR